MQDIRKQQDGFTLVELLVTMSVVVVLGTLTLPSLSGFLETQRLIGASEQVYSHLRQARLESIARSRPIFVNFSTGGDPWQYGVSHRNLCDTTLTSPTAANACVLVVDDGDGMVDPGDGSLDTGDLVAMHFSGTEHVGVSAAVTGGNLQVRFDPTRGTATTGDITLSTAAGDTLKVTVGPLGQIRICTPDDSVITYKGC